MILAFRVRQGFQMGSYTCPSSWTQGEKILEDGKEEVIGVRNVDCGTRRSTCRIFGLVAYVTHASSFLADSPSLQVMCIIYLFCTFYSSLSSSVSSSVASSVSSSSPSSLSSSSSSSLSSSSSSSSSEDPVGPAVQSETSSFSFL